MKSIPAKSRLWNFIEGVSCARLLLVQVFGTIFESILIRHRFLPFIVAGLGGMFQRSHTSRLIREIEDNIFVAPKETVLFLVS